MKITNTEKDIEKYAESVSQTVTIRTYYRRGYNGEHIPDENGGNSEDTTRASTPEEAKIIAGIIAGALESIKWHSGSCRTAGDFTQVIQHAADTAEFITLNLLPSVNTFDSIYRHIKAYKWIEEKED